MNLSGLSFLRQQNDVNVAQSGTGAALGKTAAGSDISNPGLLMLKSMSNGDTFQGEIVSVKDNQILLRLPGGTSITATLNGDFALTPGKVETFVLDNNQGQTISIKPMNASAQEITMADKALESAGLSFSEKNFEMVKELIRQNMPVDKNSLNNMARIIGKFPDTDISTLVQMTRLEIPITPENIGQFKAYQSYESSIYNDVNSLTDGIMELFQNSEIETAATINQVIDDLFMFDENKLPDKEMLNNLKSESKILEFPDIKNALDMPDITTRELLKTIVNQKEPEIINNKAVKSFLKQALGENLSFPLEEGFDKEKVQKFFAKSENILRNLEETLKKNPQTEKLAGNTENIRNNVDFMNDINKNMAYFQMPVNFSQGQGNGQLYVFTNKKKVMAKGDNLSALLHLDMENLGPVDVFVRLSGKNVGTSFTLETEEMLDFVYSRIDILNEKLEKLGYNTTVDMKVKDFDKPLNFVEDFLEGDSKPVAVNQYLFDVKA